MKTFEDAGFWLDSVRGLVQHEPDIYLVANRVDESGKRAVSKQLAMQFARKSRVHYHEVSAKTHKGVPELLEKIASRILGKTVPVVPTEARKETYAQQRACLGCMLV